MALDVMFERPCGHRQSATLWGGRVKREKELAELKAQPCPVCGAPGEPRQEQAEPVMHRPTDTTAVAPRVRTNRRGQRCHTCGGWVEAGKGRLWYEAEYESHTPGWHVEHLDPEECRAEMRRRAETLEMQARAYRVD